MHQYFASPWLKPSDRALDWHGPLTRDFVPFPHSDLERPISVLFENIASLHPNHVALDDGTTRLTYREILNAVRHLTARVTRETKPDELIGILLAPSVDFPIAMLACFAAGRPFVPLDLHYPARWIADVTQDARMAAIIGRFDNIETDAAVPPSIRRIEMAIDAGDTSPITSPPGPDEPALVLYTSGSTGKPKGIVNSQRNLLRRVEQYINAAHINAEDRFMPLSSDCTIAGLRERLTALLSGATLHLIDTQRAGARKILQRLHDDKITICYAVPALLRSLIQLDAETTPQSLRVVRVGGDAVLWSDVELLRNWLSPECLIELGYSSTEAPIMQWFVPRDFPQTETRVPIGYPLPGNALAILDEDGKPAAPGEPGELVIRSPYVALGRWIDGRCVTDDFPTDPDDTHQRILRTGDLARLRDDGLIDLIGRKDRQIKIRGQRVEPGEIEAALRRNPDVIDSAVWPRRVGETWWLIAYVVSSETASVDALKLYLKETLPPSLQPRRIYFVPEIPRLPSAKLDTKALEALDEKCKQAERLPEAANDNDAASGEVETVVANIWKRLLDLSFIDRAADFFDLGGDSLLTLNMMFEIEEALGIELPVTMIYQTPTIASLSAAIEQHVEPKFSPLVQVKTGEGRPLFIVHGVGGNVMELFEFGRQIERPVYAIQARGLDGREEPNHSIADMAAYYLSAIRAVQPIGPYNIAGYSSGGLIAFEMAQQLKVSGEKVGVLALIDTQTNARQWPVSVWLNVLRRRSRYHRAAFGALNTRDKLFYGAKIVGSFYKRILWRLGIGKTNAPDHPELRLPSALQKVFQATLEAVVNYQPSRYEGDVLLLVSDLGDPMMAEPAKIWPRYARLVESKIVPGDHRSMIHGENGKILARILSERLQACASSI